MENGKHSPFEIFPKEIWHMILEHLGNSSLDIWNVSKSSPVLQQIVVGSRKILKFELVIPLVAPWLPKTDILKCRRVSKTWKAVTDRLLLFTQETCADCPSIKSELSPLPSPFQDLLLNYIPILPGNLFIPIKTNFRLQILMNLLNKPFSHSNPFLLSSLRSVTIDRDLFCSRKAPNNYPSSTRFNESRELNFSRFLIDFAKSHGSLILHLKIIIKYPYGLHLDPDSAPSRLLNFLQDFLLETPNLKSLQLVVNHHNRCVDPTPGLSDKISTCLIPNLPQLQYLNLIENKSELQEVATVIFSWYSEQLVKVVIPGNERLTLNENYLRNLKELQLTKIDVRPTSLQKLFAKFKSPHLEKVTLEFDYALEDLMPLFEALKPMSETLEILKMDFQFRSLFPSRYEQTKTFPVTFQNLHTVELQDRPNLKYDFILHMPNLRELKIKRNSGGVRFFDESEEYRESLEEMLQETGTRLEFRRYLYSDDEKMNLYQHPTLWSCPELSNLRSIRIVNSYKWMGRHIKNGYFTREEYISKFG